MYLKLLLPLCVCLSVNTHSYIYVVTNEMPCFISVIWLHIVTYHVTNGRHCFISVAEATPRILADGQEVVRKQSVCDNASMHVVLCKINTSWPQWRLTVYKLHAQIKPLQMMPAQAAS